VTGHVKTYKTESGRQVTVTAVLAFQTPDGRKLQLQVPANVLWRMGRRLAALESACGREVEGIACHGEEPMTDDVQVFDVLVDRIDVTERPNVGD
jgi:hypothetical protein